MSSSDSDSDSNSLFDSDTSSSEDDSFSITKSLLAEPIYREDPFESSSKLTRNLIQTTLALVPLVVMHTMSKKRHYSGSTHGQGNVPLDNKRRNEQQNSNDDFMGEEVSKYSHEVFRRHFRMDKDLFSRILVAIKGYDDCFTQKVDASCRPGLSPIQKMIASLKMLAHGVPAIDEYGPTGQITALESLIRFCDTVMGVFEGRYLRKPNGDDIKRLLKQNEARRFPGMIGSIDCMHWKWTNCPMACQVMATNGFKKVPTLVLEIVASEDLWIWHAFLGMAGTDNDITVLDRSSLFDDTVNGGAPPCKFEVRGHHYDTEYYLSDGIYPPHATLLQAISEPSNRKEQYFSKQHEIAGKDVERAFGVLLKRWHIINGLGCMWNADDMRKIVKTCIILHNMIIESERIQGFDPESWEPPASKNIQNVELEHDHHFLADFMINRFKQVRDMGVQNDLKRDLIDNMWTLHGSDPF